VRHPFRRTPEAVRAIALTERRLAWGVAQDGTALVATPSALHLGHEVLPWTHVERVSWKPDVLTIVESAPVEGAGERRVFRLVEQSRLAEAIHTGVTSSIAWSDRRRLGTGHVRLVGRRTPDVDALTWQVVWETPALAADPAAQAQAERWVLELRATIG
jgi:hypothetical protein